LRWASGFIAFNLHHLRHCSVKSFALLYCVGRTPSVKKKNRVYFSFYFHSNDYAADSQKIQTTGLTIGTCQINPTN